MTQPSRRAILRAAVVAAATIAVPGAFSTQAAGLSGLSGPTRLRRREFRPQVGTTFVLESGGLERRGRLVAVRDQSTRTAGQEGRFSLLFEVGGAPPEGIYAMRHPVLQPFDLFLAPVGPKDRGLYEAVVNS